MSLTPSVFTSTLPRLAAATNYGHQSYAAMDSEPASERPSDSTGSASETYTSFTSNDSSRQSAAEVADLLLQLVGHKTERKLNHLRRIFRGSLPHNSHLIEVAKLSTYPKNPDLQWKRANEEAQKQNE